MKVSEKKFRKRRNLPAEPICRFRTHSNSEYDKNPNGDHLLYDNPEAGHYLTETMKRN
jgi:hypothetical protein